jgi:phosphopantothenoylcysteine decarboxylase/phosphopantothenate--cysteine ligase
MNIIVTAGPTYEPLDQVRRLTNFSTGRLGSELARYFTERGHSVTLLIGEQATSHGEPRAGRVQSFTTTSSLGEKLRALANPEIDAVFHAAAVSDFAFGKAWERSEGGELKQLTTKKIPTRAGAILVELIPTPKLIHELRGWFPKAKLVGWKYEMDGDRATVLSRAARQIEESKTDYCVANGAAYGAGFGILDPAGSVEHCETMRELFPALEKRLKQ